MENITAIVAVFPEFAAASPRHDAGDVVEPSVAAFAGRQAAADWIAARIGCDAALLPECIDPRRGAFGALRAPRTLAAYEVAAGRRGEVDVFVSHAPVEGPRAVVASPGLWRMASRKNRWPDFAADYQYEFASIFEGVPVAD